VKDQPRIDVFTNAAHKIIPDPLAYRDWFAHADEKRRRIAVGTRRYSTVAAKVNGQPEWEDFLDPATGDLLPLEHLKNETHEDRQERLDQVFDMLMRQRRELARVGVYGFQHEPELPTVGERQQGFTLRRRLGPMVGGS
jgi:hypothetical protein